MAKISALQLVRQNFPQYDRDRAAALVSCRNVYVNGQLCTNPHELFEKDSTVEIMFPKYVSRGGFKLEAALDAFDFPIENRVMLDAGSSTGGFTHCLLQRGAAAVHCVDVGFNLLDFSLRSDSRVILHEKCNIMDIKSFVPQPDAAVADLSFRSIHGAAGHILDLTQERRLIALIKPQFEVPKGIENFDGVVRDIGLLRETLRSVCSALKQDGTGIFDAVRSPIKGHKGNTEFLVLLSDFSSSALSESDFLEKLFS